MTNICKAYEGSEPYIFVSYSHKDTDTVIPIIRALQENGFRIWYDAGIEAGSEWPENIADHLYNSGCVICCITQNALESHNCRREINYAIELQKDMLVVYLSETTLTRGMQMQLNSLQAIFRYRYSNETEFLQMLMKAKILQKCRGKSVEVIPSSASTTAQPCTRTEKDSKTSPEVHIPQKTIAPAKEIELQQLIHKAEAGDIRAQLKLGNIYSVGTDVSKDDEKAAFWYQKAAEQGDAEAQYQMGMAYSWGFGVDEDEEKGAFWYQKAAEQGHSEAQFELSECYRVGIGVKKDDALADYWQKLSEESASNP